MQGSLNVWVPAPPGGLYGQRWNFSPGPREWLRWIRAWTRGYGHRWVRDGQSVLCSRCGLFAVPDLPLSVRAPRKKARRGFAAVWTSVRELGRSPHILRRLLLRPPSGRPPPHLWPFGLVSCAERAAWLVQSS